MARSKRKRNVKSSAPPCEISQVDTRLDQSDERVLQLLEDLHEKFDSIGDRLTCSIDTETPSHLDGPDETLLRQPEAELLEDIQRLQAELDTAWRDNEELRQQNADLASRVAEDNVQKTVDSGETGDESLSWDDRKQLILQQMENDTFDADRFVESLSDSARAHFANEEKEENNDSDACEEDAASLSDIPSWPSTPLELVDYFQQELEFAQTDVANKNEEIQELKFLLQQQAETRDGGVAIGAAAIASMVDSDELVMEERERLQQIKTDWEDKFRQAEIEASLERAKLSRERQELSKRTADLEEQLERLQRAQSDERAGVQPGRRWFAELGLDREEQT